jgi:hypothetical protein
VRDIDVADVAIGSRRADATATRRLCTKAQSEHASNRAEKRTVLAEAQTRHTRRIGAIPRCEPSERRARSTRASGPGRGERGLEDWRGHVRLDRSAILKLPQSRRERGVLLVSFESELDKLAHCQKLSELEEAYQIVFLPTWQPFYSGALFRFVRRARRPFFVMPSTSRDASLCSEVSPMCEALPFQASSWVPSTLCPRAASPRDIDLLMLANFSKYKRHWRLFEALASLPRQTRAVVAGRPLEGRTSPLRREASVWRRANRFVENPATPGEHAPLESACLFAPDKRGIYIGVAGLIGATVAMYKIRIGSGIKSETGFLCHLDTTWCATHGLPRRSWSMDPATWARANRSADVNVLRWNALMRERSEKCGEPWTVDIPHFFCRNFAFLVNDPELRASLKAEEVRCAKEFGVAVESGA